MARTTLAPASAPAEAGMERRKWERADLVVRVDYNTVDEFFSEFARNINEGGLFVETDTPQETGSAIALQFCLPGCDGPVEVTGRVVRVSKPGSADPSGMGIEFDDLGAQERELINELVRNLRSER